MLTSCSHQRHWALSYRVEGIHTYIGTVLTPTHTVDIRTCIEWSEEIANSNQSCDICRRLGVSADANFEEVQDARNFLYEASHRQCRWWQMRCRPCLPLHCYQAFIICFPFYVQCSAHGTLHENTVLQHEEWWHSFAYRLTDIMKPAGKLLNGHMRRFSKLHSRTGRSSVSSRPSLIAGQTSKATN